MSEAWAAAAGGREGGEACCSWPARSVAVTYAPHLVAEGKRGGRGGTGNGPPVCIALSLSLSLYLGWASDGLAVVVRQAGTHFKLAHAAAAATDDDEPLSCNNNNAFLK